MVIRNGRFAARQVDETAFPLLVARKKGNTHVDLLLSRIHAKILGKGYHSI